MTGAQPPRHDGDTAHPLPTDDASTQATPTQADETADSEAVSGYPNIPDYEFLGLLGRGGMGSVYLARKRGDGPNPAVAIKVVAQRAGVYRERFVREREIMHRLQHPAIARLYEVGSTDDGEPYLAMEYIDGQNILAFCDAHGLALKARLRLFVRVCRGLAYAHRNLVVHRDIKPDNILVTSEGEPKILDFGIAKLLEDEAREGPAMTATGMPLYTLQYASPEQLNRQPVTMATDVYSAGLVLFELLTGRSPYAQADQTAPTELTIFRAMSSGEIASPSAALRRLHQTGRAVPEAVSRLVQARGERSTARLRARLRGELDSIVMTALQTDPEARYPRIEDLADDIERHLDGRAIAARPSSVAYRTGKFLRRHAWAVTAVTGIVVLSVTLAVTMTHQARTLAAERDRVEQARQAEAEARAEVERVAEFQARQLERIDPTRFGLDLRAGLVAQLREAESTEGGEQVTPVQLEALLANANFTDLALEALDDNLFAPALAVVAEEFADQPLVQARLLQTLATTLRGLGRYASAEDPQARAVALRTAELGPTDPATLASRSEQARLLFERGALAEAETRFREILQLRRAQLGSDHPATLRSLNDLAQTLRNQGRFTQAQPLAEQALAGRRRALGEEHVETLESLNVLATVRQGLGELAQAEALFRQGLATSRQVLGEDHPHTANWYNQVAVALAQQGKYDAAEPFFRRALEGSRRLRGSEHPSTQILINNMARLLKTQGKLDEAEAHYREALRLNRRILGPEHPTTLITMNNMGGLLRAQDKPEAARELYAQVLEIRRKRFGADAVDTLAAQHNLSAVLRELGDLARAEALSAEAVALARQSLPAGHPRLGQFLLGHGQALIDQGRFAHAEHVLSEAKAVLEAAGPGGAAMAAEARTALLRLPDRPDATEPTGGAHAKADP